ncbi:MAG: alpha-ribazole phosphatase [Clostridiaceae bacterium]|jgi:alpha-ribazole phosphatase|nr:alpha-ribazole phosphatase [Clostridiaceae bacterium]
MKSGRTEIYLIRHGETEMNIKGVYYGWTDCGLSEKGIMQAEDLADILSDVCFDAVISSSLSRAVETATIVSGYDPDDIIKDDRLRELNFGDWEGIHYSELKEKHKEAWEKWGSDWKNTPPPGGESFFEIYIRVKSSIEDILKEYKGKRVLIVSHHGTMRIIPMVLLGLTEEAYWSFTAEQGRYSHYDIDEKGHCIIKRINSGR